MKNNLKKYRKMLKLRQEDLAKSLNTTRQTINSIELGKHNPGLRLAFKIAKEFNCSIEELFFYDDA
ncbi:helix-turn-helix transcriptional regulator [Candidatus Woesearchaeota archaeon]|nr:helix-turn-helix transcriptional regulator [Candidatus Woesearchaeota archaeon]